MQFRWVFCLNLVSIVLFQIHPVFAEDKDLKVEVRLSSAKERIIPPRSLLTSVFIIINSGEEEDTYIVTPDVPDGWYIISTFSPILLSPGETRTIPMTVSVPAGALTDYTYRLGLSVTSRSNPQISDHVTFEVKVLPRARVKLIAPEDRLKARGGQTISYTFTVMNLGNGRDIFRLDVTSAHGDKVRLSHDSIELDAGEKKEIKATIHIPLDVSEGTSHVVTLQASSIHLEKGVSDKAVVYTSLLARRRPKEEGIYRTLPAHTIFHLSGIGTGRELGPQGEFYTNGYIDDRHWLNFSFQGPRYKDKENYKGLSEERVSFELGSDVWDIGIGDTTVSLSDLTVSSLSEEGVRFQSHLDPFRFKVFHLEKKDSSFREDLSGARIAGKIGDGTEVGINYFRSDEENIDRAVTRSPEDKEIMSMSSVHQFKDIVIKSEYAVSRFDEGTGEEKDSAWWIDARLRKEKYYLYTEYIHAGSSYPGRRTDSDGYRTYLSYNLVKPLWVWIRKSQMTNNLNNDPDKATDDVDRNEIGASFLSKKFPYLSLSYKLDKTKSNQAGALVSDSKDDSILFRAQDTYGRFSVSFDYQLTRNKDDIKSVDRTASDYTTRLYASWTRWSSWAGYGYNIEEDNIYNTRTSMTRKEAGLTYRPFLKLYTSISFSQEETTGQDKTDTASLDMTYVPFEGTSIALEGEYRDAHSDDIEEWQFWFSVRKSFDIPLPFSKVRGRLVGNLFIDEDNDGISDKGEQGISRVVLLLDGKKAVSDKKGRFRFPSLTPGEYELNTDISSIPFGLGPSVELPYKVKIEKGEAVNVIIPFVRVCKVKGVVFEDKNKNKKRDKGEKGIGLVRVVLIKEGEILRDTFSDSDGSYGFAGILPGKYEVRIDTEWIPQRYELTTSQSYSIELKPQEEVLNLDFGLIEKEKKIIKTYVAPEVKKVDTIHIEEEKE